MVLVVASKAPVILLLIAGKGLSKLLKIGITEVLGPRQHIALGGTMMEAEKENSGKNEVNGTRWWWTLASMVQLGWAISAFRRGYRGSSNLMPVKAFGVATLFVGSGASASVASLQFSGIHKVEDFLEVGANIRTRLGIRPRAEEKTDDL